MGKDSRADSPDWLLARASGILNMASGTRIFSVSDGRLPLVGSNNLTQTGADQQIHPMRMDEIHHNGKSRRKEFRYMLDPVRRRF
jgi:hypothetical protein